MSLLLAAYLALWLFFPDQTFVFDGVIFAQIVERAVDEWRRTLWNPRHLLFNPFFLILRDLLGKKVAAYRLFQIVNAVAGAAGLFFVADLAGWLGESAELGILAAFLLGATLCYATRATEGQVYMFMSLGAIAVVSCAARLIRRPSIGAAAWLVAAYAAAVLFHAANAFLLPALVLALWFAFPEKRPYVAAGTCAAGAAIVIPYLAAFAGTDLRSFFSVATDFHAAQGAGFWSGLAANYLFGDQSLFARGILILRETGLAVAQMPQAAALILGIGIWSGTAAAAWNFWPALDAPRKKTVLVLAAAWIGYSIVNAFWPGGLFFYVPPHAFAILILAAAGGVSWQTLNAGIQRQIMGAATALIAGLLFITTRWGLLPQSKIENNAGVRDAIFIGDHTEPASWIVISGLGLTNAKAYIPKFAHRTREILELYFNHLPKEVALSRISGFVESQTAHGIPIYLLSDLVEAGDAQNAMKKLWDVGPADIESAFGPGRVVALAGSPTVNVYLYVPKRHQPELFVVLGYSVLSETDMRRLPESVNALKEIAREMPESERRRAVALIQEKNWGFDLLMEGFAPVMSAESVAAAHDRRDRFEAWKKTPEFWLRAGNLYDLLGQKKETLDAWTKAEQMTGDKDLSQAIEKYRAKMALPK